MKKVCVSIVGSGQLHEITIQPGTTAGDILRDLNLSDYLLSSNPSADFFANSESVYEKVSDGQKIFASTKATVGRGLFGRLRDTVEKYLPINKAQSSITIRPTSRFQTIHPTPVRRQQLPYWQSAGWSRAGNVYRGNYQTRYGAFQGWIEESLPGQISFYILEPPEEVLNSSHGPCFQMLKGNRWFHIHMSSRPKDVSSGILAIERLIADCFGSRR